MEEIEIADGIILCGSDGATGKNCAWSGEEIDGPYVRFYSYKTSRKTITPITRTANIAVSHIDEFCDEIVSFEAAGHGQLYRISPTADYIQYVQTSPSNTASESYCAVCSCTVSDNCEIRLENVSIHVDCIDELVSHLDKVWNYSDEILCDTLQEQ